MDIVEPRIGAAGLPKKVDTFIHVAEQEVGQTQGLISYGML